MFQDWYELLKIVGVMLAIVSPIIAKVWRVSSRFERLKTDTREQGQDIDTLKSTTTDNTNRITNLETNFENLPSKEDISSLRLLMEKMNGKVDTLAEREKGNKESMNRIEHIVQRQQDYLMEKDK